AAPGESFADTFATNPSLALAGYNPNNGVAIRGVAVQGISTLDNVIVISRLQITSDSAAAIYAPARACNACVFDHNILESGIAAVAVTNCGYGCWWHNNLLIA